MWLARILAAAVDVDFIVLVVAAVAVHFHLKYNFLKFFVFIEVFSSSQRLVLILKKRLKITRKTNESLFWL